MGTCCYNKKVRVKQPNGTWGYQSMVGAKVKVKSTAVTNFFSTFLASDTCTISDIYFQVSLDGKCITVIELAEQPGKFFTWKDLEIVELVNENLSDAICNFFVAGDSICGRNVSHEPTWLEDIKGGIAIIDKDGNVIVNRYIRLTQGKAEDIPMGENGEYNITDVTICGDIIK